MVKKCINNNYIYNVFSIDTRALGIFRISIGILIIVDIIIRLFYIEDFYTWRGILPNDVVIGKLSYYHKWSIFFINDSFIFVLSIFIITMIISLSFALGYKTKLCNFLLWIYFVSLISRNGYIVNSGDAYMAILLFWGLFLPLNCRYSLDNEIGTSKPIFGTIFNLPTCAILLQVGLLYFFAVLHKTGKEWQVEHSAIYYLFSTKNLIREFTLHMLNYPKLLEILTALTLYLQFYGTILLFCPFFVKYVRLIILTLFFGFHISLMIFTKINLFPYICLAPLLLFFPKSYWDLIFKFLRKINIFKNDNESYNPSFETSDIEEIKTYNYSWANVLKHITINLSVFLLVVYIFVLNIRSLKSVISDKFLPYKYTILANVLRINQNWAMFSPYPGKVTFHLEIKGKLINGNTITLDYLANPIDYKNASYNNKYVLFSDRWKKYISNLVYDDKLTLSYGRYLTRKWNRTHKLGETLDTFKINVVKERTLDPIDFYDKNKNITNNITKNVLWSHNCLTNEERSRIISEYKRDENTLIFSLH